MSNFCRFWAIFAILISKMALFLILSLMHFFSKSSGVSVKEARNVNNTGVLYTLQAATFRSIYSTLPKCTYSSLVLIQKTAIINDGIMCGLCLFIWWICFAWTKVYWKRMSSFINSFNYIILSGYTFGTLLTKCFDWQVLCLFSSLLMIATMPKDSAFIYLSFPGFVFIYELWTLSVRGSFCSFSA